MKKLIHPLLGRIFNTTHQFQGNAQEVVGDHLHNDLQVLLAFEHEKIFDPFIMAAVVHKEPALRPMEAKSIVAVKAEAYKWIPPVEWFLWHAGGFPAFRYKDVDNARLNPPANQKEAKRHIRIAGNHVVDIATTALNDGYNVALFPRGERRDRQDISPVTARNLRRGIGRIATGVNDRSKLLVVPGAVNYSNGIFHPTLAIGEPFKVEEDDTPDSVVALLAPRIQQSRELAAELAA